MVTFSHSTSRIPFLLLVEDDPDDQELLVEATTRLEWNHKLAVVPNVDRLFEALDQIGDPGDFPTLIILDNNLPGLSGETALVLLKKDLKYRHIPVAIYSTSLSKEKEGALLAGGANFCRQKPTTLQGLEGMVAEFLAFADPGRQAPQKKGIAQG